MGQRRSPSEEADDGKGPGIDYVIEEASWRVRDMPERLRPREEMARRGVRFVADDVLIAVILRSGVQGRNVVSLARDLLREHGSVRGLAECSVEELAARKGMGGVKAQVLSAALELGRRLTEESLPKRARVRTPADAARLLHNEVLTLEKEVFWVMALDTKNYLKGRPAAVTTGLLDASLVHPREVFREAIRRAAAGVVLAHNHPSGDVSPSAEDVRVTRQLIEAGRVVDINVLDHVILGAAAGKDGADFLSMRESGVANFEAGRAARGA